MNAGDRDLVDELQGADRARGRRAGGPARRRGLRRGRDGLGPDAGAMRSSVESPATEAHFRASTH